MSVRMWMRILDNHLVPELLLPPRETLSMLSKVTVLSEHMLLLQAHLLGKLSREAPLVKPDPGSTMHYQHCTTLSQCTDPLRTMVFLIKLRMVPQTRDLCQCPR